MAENDKGTEVAVEKRSEPSAPPRSVSRFGAWPRELDDLFEDFLFRWPRLRELEAFRFPRESRLQEPTLDMYEEKDEVVVKAEMPGMAKEDIEVTLSDSSLILKGEKKKEEEVKEKNYHRCEREYRAVATAA